MSVFRFQDLNLGLDSDSFPLRHATTNLRVLDLGFRLKG